MRIFIDTNILISAIIFPGSKTAYVLKYILECHESVICSYTINECFEVFKRKFPDKISMLEIFFKTIDYIYFDTPEHINRNDFPDIRDPDDLTILASAILSDSDILLTGDKDFDEVKIEHPLLI